MLAGAGRGCGGCPPTNESSAEMTTSAARLLRRGQPLRELGLSSGERASHRSWASGNSLSSCGRMLAGAERGCGGCPPTNEHSSEVAMSAAACSGEDNLYGSWCLPPGNAGSGCCDHYSAPVRNVSRRKKRGGRPNFGEAAVVGGDDLFGCFPPAGHPFTGGNGQLR